MKTYKYTNVCQILSFIILFSVLVTTASVGQISVIVSKSSTQTISKDDAVQIFSGTKTTWPNGNKVQVVDQSESEVGGKFYDTFLSKSVNKVRLQWTKLVLSGQATAPIKATDDEDVKKNVSKDPNNIGYINSKSLDPSVKELFRIE